MALPHFGGKYRPPIITKNAKKFIKYNFKIIKTAFKNADISLNGQGKDIVFLSGPPSFYKLEIIENGIKYLLYTTSDSSNTISEYCTLDNKLHREIGPAYIEKSENDILEFAYFKNNKLHKDDGPATMGTYYNEKLYAFWYNGKFLSKEKFNIILRKKKLQKICQKSS